MERIWTAAELKKADAETLELGLASPVLMERAALAVLDVMLEEKLDLSGAVVVSDGVVSGGASDVSDPEGSSDGTVSSPVEARVSTELSEPGNSESISFFRFRMYVKKMAKKTTSITLPAMMARMIRRFLLIRRASPM